MVDTAGPPSLAYPLRYAPSTGLRWLVVGASLILFAVGLVGIFAPLFAKSDGLAEFQIFLILVGVLLALFAIYGIRFAYRTALILYPDRLEYRGGLRTLVLNRADISGRTQEQEGQYATSFKVISRAPRRLKLSIDLYAAPDEAFRAWFAAIPLIDAWRPDAIKASASADPAWGSSPEERASRMAGAVKVAGVISVIGYIAALIGIFFPTPFALWIIVLTLAPPAFFVWTLACRGRWSIRSAKEDPRPQVGDAVGMPALALGLRGLLDTHIYDLAPLLAACTLIAIGAAFASYDIAKSGPRPRVTVLLVLVVTSIWAYGAISEANVQLDRGPPAATHAVALIRKDVSHGKSTTYSLVTKSWRGRKSTTSTDVPRALWDSLRVGDDVCINDHAGALFLRWYSVSRCSISTTAPRAELPS